MNAAPLHANMLQDMPRHTESTLQDFLAAVRRYATIPKVSACP